MTSGKGYNSPVEVAQRWAERERQKKDDKHSPVGYI
jgi:hypothetical protein